MFSTILLISAVVAVVRGNCGECPTNPGHYDALQCKGRADQHGDCCSIKFECPKIELSEDTCWANGKTYKLGEEIPTTATGPCRHCICTPSYKGGPGSLNCAHTDCPPSPPIRSDEPECVGQYSVDSCCATSHVCGEAVAKLPTCLYRGQNATRGERIYPNNEKCYTCVCNEHFIDHQNPSSQPKACRKIECPLDTDVEVLNKFCAPVYYKDRCCPHAWECPKAEVKIISDKPSPRPHLECKFGSTTVPFGHGVQVDEKCTTCTCETPPYVTCWADNKCQLAALGLSV